MPNTFRPEGRQAAEAFLLKKASLDASVRPAGEKGCGVFADRAFRAGEVVERAPIVLLKDREVGKTLDNYIYKWRGKTNALALGYGSVYNHADNPNMDFDRDFKRDRLVYTAKRDIPKGEELTVNYGGDEHFKMKFDEQGGYSFGEKTGSAPKGYYKGQPSDPEGVKFHVNFQGIDVLVERPKGFIMVGQDAKGVNWARRYKLDYGHIPKTLGGDGDGLDVFLGPDKKANEAYWAIQRKDDGSFDEYKVFLGFPDRDAAVAAYRQHIPKKYLKGIITLKVQMMRAMLGNSDPEEIMKTATVSSFLDELGWLESTTCRSKIL